VPERFSEKVAGSSRVMVRGEFLRQPIHYTAGQTINELDLSCSRAFSLLGIF